MYTLGLVYNYNEDDYMFRNELKKRLLKNKNIKALNDTESSTLIEQAYERALPLLQRQTWGSLFISDRPASKEDMIEMLEQDILSNLDCKQSTPRP